MTHYTFYFDSSSCSGCKACQAACKDKHGLEVGRLWRRVYEVSGGGWQAVGASWQQTVFAYNLSISCNHCEQPICMEVCPAKAIRQRPDGIVLIDSRRCLGCRYCAWACPYGAPQYDEQAGRMTKCTFCYDELEQGRPPACVAACPLRALDYGDRAELEQRYGPLSTAAPVFPLPASELTSPALLLTPHAAAPQAEREATPIGNEEEVR